MKKVLLIAIGIILLGVSTAASVNLPKTGQNNCYDSSGNIIPCSGTGQDGDWKAGISFAPRFTFGAGPETECITDNLTGLMWVKTPDSANKLPWQTALDYVKSVANSSGGFCSHGDWRLPGVVELETMTNAGQPDSGAWLNTQGFSNIQSADGYWSSTSFAGMPYTYMAFGVYMAGGRRGIDNKTNSNYVWPVRGNYSILLTWQANRAII